MDAPTDCAACRIAELDPSSKLADDHCRACRVRKAARAVVSEREAIYDQVPPDELAAFVADVWEAIARLHGAARTETVWARAGEEG